MPSLRQPLGELHRSNFILLMRTQPKGIERLTQSRGRVGGWVRWCYDFSESTDSQAASNRGGEALAPLQMRATTVRKPSTDVAGDIRHARASRYMSFHLPRYDGIS